MDDEILEGDGVGGFEGALDLIQGVDAAGLFRMEEVDGGSAGAAHFAVGKERSVHGPGGDGVGAKPGGEFGDVLAAGVVEVLAGGKELDGLRAGAGGQL